MEAAKPDKRRAAGELTRRRLMDATMDLIAGGGDEAVTLRGVTDAADANVAAVSYHFGSLQSLCEAAVEHALERYLDAQQEALSSLGPDSTIDDLAASFIRPMINALTVGGQAFDVMRIVARSGIDPPPGWDRLGTRFDEIRADVLRVLKANVPKVKEQELILRTRVVAGMLNWLILSPVGDDLRKKSTRQLERLLVPVFAGAFRGTSPA